MACTQANMLTSPSFSKEHICCLLQFLATESVTVVFETPEVNNGWKVVLCFTRVWNETVARLLDPLVSDAFWIQSRTAQLLLLLENNTCCHVYLFFSLPSSQNLCQVEKLVKQEHCAPMAWAVILNIAVSRWKNCSFDNGAEEPWLRWVSYSRWW